jgi:hypothetical protein
MSYELRIASAATQNSKLITHNLFQSVGYVRHQSQVAGLCDGLGHFALKLQAGAGEAAGQHAALLVHELQQEVRVFVVHVLNAVLLKAAVFLAGVLRLVHSRPVVVPVECGSCHITTGLLGYAFGFFCSLLQVHLAVAAAGVVFHSVLIKHGGQEPDDALVAAESQLKHVNDVAFSSVRQAEIVACGFLLNWVRQLAQAPGFSGQNGGAIFLKHLGELLDRLLHLALVQHGSYDEDRLVISYFHYDGVKIVR